MCVLTYLLRAKMAETPEASDYTSIKKRIQCAKSEEGQPKQLMDFAGNPREPMPKGLPFELKDYIELVDWTGRIIRADKAGYIPSNMPPILDRVGIPIDSWLTLTKEFEKQLNTFAGSDEHIDVAATQLGYKRTPNRKTCHRLFG